MGGVRGKEIGEGTGKVSKWIFVEQILEKDEEGVVETSLVQIMVH